MQFLRAACALAFVTAAACGGGGSGDDVVVVDAAVDVAIDAPSIDGPPVCNGMVCGADCIDTTTAEDHCGSCTTVCRAGEACDNSVCACAPHDFMPNSPDFIQQMILTNVIPQTSLGIGGVIGGQINALIVAHPDAAPLNTPIPLSGANPGVPPFVALGYDIDLNTTTPAAAFYATSGTITFTASCAGGFAGTATNLHFTAASGLMPPMVVTNDCAFDYPMDNGMGVGTLTFTYGNACP